MPVISDDLCPDTFGVGSFIFPDGEDGDFLTYSAEIYFFEKTS